MSDDKLSYDVYLTVIAISDGPIKGGVRMIMDIPTNEIDGPQHQSDEGSDDEDQGRAHGLLPVRGRPGTRSTESDEAHYQWPTSGHVPDARQDVKHVAGLLVDMMDRFYGCTREQHEAQIVGMEEDMLMAVQSDADGPVYSMDDINFLGEKTLRRPYTEVFKPGEMLRRETALNLGPSDWRGLCRGIRLGGEPNRMPPILSMHHSQPEDAKEAHGPQWARPPLVMFDIDSVIGIPSSLRVARQGIEVTFYPQFVRNIQKDLHITIAIEDMNRPTQPLVKVKVHQIPHFQLGSILGSLCLQIFVFVPAWYIKDSPTNFPTKQQLARFYNGLFFPALYKHGRADFVQHMPSSFEMAERNARAASYEGLSQKISYRTQGLQ